MEYTEKKMETTGMIGVIWWLYRDHGKENGNYYNFIVYWGILGVPKIRGTILGVPIVGMAKYIGVGV